VELTPAELTVLGLVIERPQHGYDLEQVIEQRGIRQWTDIGFSSIYYVLTKLEQRGLLHVPQAPAAAKSRRVFHATTAGREVAARNALAFVAAARAVAHPLLVGLANLSLLSAQSTRGRCAPGWRRSTPGSPRSRRCSGHKPPSRSPRVRCSPTP
jgi:DNA-binding PadR family transcriptional regulator